MARECSRKTTGPDGQRGSSLTEAAICLPILLLLIQGSLHFGHGYLYKQETIVAARYMTFRQMREDDSTIQSSEYEGLFKRNHPISGEASYETRSASWSGAGMGGAAAAAGAVFAATREPLYMTPPALGAPLLGADSTSQVSVEASFKGFLPFIPESRVSAVHTVPGDNSWTKDDLSGDTLFYLPQTELYLYAKDKLID